jgi:hypothetical protein
MIFTLNFDNWNIINFHNFVISTEIRVTDVAVYEYVGGGVIDE